MKKILWLSLSLIIAIFSFACAAPAAYIDLVKPWHGVYEKATYDVSFYYYLKNDQTANANLKDKIILDPLENNAPKIKIASGTMDYIIEQDDETKNTWKLSTNLSMTYLPKEDFSEAVLGKEEYNNFVGAKAYLGIKNFGVTDTMSSTVVFNMNSDKLFRPISVSKSFNELSKAENTTDPITLDYSFDYTSRKLTYSYNGESQKTNSYKAKEIKSGYDNEQLFLFVRALDKESFATGSSLSINNVYNWTDATAIEEPTAYTINMSVDEKLKSLPVSESFLPQLEGVATDSKLSVYDVTLSKSSTNQSGSPLKVWYSKMGISADGLFADKLMIKAVQETKDVSQVRRVFSISYDIAALEIR